MYKLERAVSYMTTHIRIYSTYHVIYLLLSYGRHIPFIWRTQQRRHCRNIFFRGYLRSHSSVSGIKHRLMLWRVLPSESPREGTSGAHLVQPPHPSRATQSQLPRTMPRGLLSISKDGDSTTSLGNLCHPQSKKMFPDVQKEPPVFQVVPTAPGPGTEHHWKEPGSILFAPLVLSLGTTEKSLAPSSWHPLFRYSPSTWLLEGKGGCFSASMLPLPSLPSSRLLK